MSACKSVPLIRPVKAPEPQFLVMEEGANFLRSLEGPLYVVSVVGVMRQGKSFILGLLAGGPGIFRLGHQTKSCTEGVDVFARPHPSGRGHLVFLDVEGQGSPDRNDTYDAALTTVAMLLSSMVVYNCLSVGTSADVDKLELLSGFMQNIFDRTSEEHGECEAAGSDRFCPALMWLLRDFFLEMVANEKPCDADTYLEEVLLAPVSGASRAAKDKNRKLNDIKQVLQKRCLRTLPRPVDDENFRQLEIDGLDGHGVRPEFREQVQRIIQEILETVPRKRFDGGELTGAALAELAGHLTLTLKDGVPEVASAWHQVCLAQTRMALQRASDSFKQSMCTAQEAMEASGRQKRHTALRPPMSSHLLKQTLKDATAAARSAYFTTAFQTDEEQARRLNDSLAHAAEEAHRDNEEVARSFCRDLLQVLYAPVESSVEGKRYICGGGYTQYMQDAAGIQHEYAECCQDTLVPEHVVTEIGEEFWRSTENIRKILRDSDKQLSEAEKEKAKQGEQLVQLELRRKQEWEENKAQLQRQEAENQERMRTWEQAMGSMKDQMRVQQEDMQRASEQREAQMAEFIQQGQVEARKQMQDIMKMASEQAMAQQEHMSSLLTSMQDSQRSQQESMNEVMISLRDLANRPPPKIEVQRSCAVQ